MLSNPINSIVAILTLELTGIPVHDPDRKFPWQKPEFIPKTSTRSSVSVFDVSIFESGDADFVVPLNLYLWRVQQLEKAAKKNKSLNGIMVTDFYYNSDGEDAVRVTGNR